MFYLIFLLIAGFLLAFSYPTGSELLYFNPFVTISGCILIVFIYIILGLFKSTRYLKQIKTNPTPEVIKKYRRWSFIYRSFILVIYAIQLYFFNWPLVITYWAGLDNVIFLTDFLVIFPYLLIYILSFLPFYRIDCYFRKSDWKAGEYLLFQIRSYFALAIAPLAIFILYANLIQHWQSLEELVYVYPFIEWFIALGLMLLLYAGSPFFLKIIWGLKRLPEGGLRSRLELLMNKTGVAVRDIMVWPIGLGRMANAMVVGLLPRWRYVIFTDTLLNGLNDDEIESVFAHEIGHARQSHLLVYLIVFLGYFGLAITLEQILANIFPGSNYLIEINLFMFMAIYWLMLFGFVSRKLEHQADLFGALIINGFDAFINALNKIASLNAIVQSEKSIQHPSIERRITFLLSAQYSKEHINNFMNSLKRIVYILTVILAFAMIGWSWSMYNQIRKIPELKTNLSRINVISRMTKEAGNLLENKKYPEARKIMEEVVQMQPNNPYFYILLGDAQAEGQKNLTQEAISSYQMALSLKVKNPVNRLYLKEKLGK